MAAAPYQLLQKEVVRASTNERLTQYSVRFSEDAWQGGQSGPTFSSFPPGSNGLGAVQEDQPAELVKRAYRCIVQLFGISFIPKHVHLLFVDKDPTSRGQYHVSIPRAKVDRARESKVTFVFFELDPSLQTVHAMGGIRATDFWQHKRSKPLCYELPRTRLQPDIWFDAVSLQQESRSGSIMTVLDSSAALTGSVRTFFELTPSSLQMLEANISMAHMLRARFEMLDATARFQHTNQLSKTVGLGSVATHASVKTESEVRTLLFFADVAPAVQIAAHQATFHAFRAHVYSASMVRAGKIEKVERDWFRRQEIVLLTLLFTNSPHLYSEEEVLEVLCAHFNFTPGDGFLHGQVGAMLELDVPLDDREVLGVEGTVVRFSKKFLLDHFLPIFLEQKIRSEDEDVDEDAELARVAEKIREERKSRRAQTSRYMPTKEFDESVLPDIEDLAGNKLLSPLCVLRLRKKLEEDTTERFKYPERLQYTGALLDTNRSTATVERHLRRNFSKRGIGSADFDKDYASSCKRRETGLWADGTRTIPYGQSCSTLGEAGHDKELAVGCPFAQNVRAELDVLLAYAEVPQPQRKRIKEIASDGQGRAARRACACMFVSVFKVDGVPPPAAPRVYFGRAWEIVRKTLASMPDA